MDCVELKTAYGPTPIYIHDISVDRWVSGNVKRTGTWEPGNIQLIVSLLKKDPELGFMDLGSHMGVFSLSVAKFGRKVVSVDPLIENVQRLCKSVQKGGFTENVTIIFNPLSDKHAVVNFKREVGNIGGTTVVEASKATTNADPGDDSGDSYTVTLDDILPLLPFKKAILKMDVQEHEYHVLRGATKFFQHVHVPAILMEWVLMKTIPDAENVINLLIGNNYKAYKPKINGAELEPIYYKTWPYDIIWIKS
jgi:FkbM family methyltransferase